MATRKKGRRRSASARRKSTGASTRRRRRRSTAAATPRRRRRSSAKRRSSSLRLTRVRGRIFRANPPRGRGFGGIVEMVMQGAKDAAIITGGKAASNVVSRMVPGMQTPALRLVTQIAAAVAVGFVGNRFISADVGRLAMAGGLTAAVESGVRMLNLPVITPALGDDVLMGYDGAYLGDVGAYPAIAEGVGAYPSDGVAGDMETYYQ